MAVPARKQVEDDRRPPAFAFLPPGGGQDEPALEAMRRGAHALALVPRQLGKLGGAERPGLEQRFGDVALDRRELLVAEVLRVPGAAGERVEGGQHAEGDERGPAAQMLPRADEPLFGELVLPPPDAGEVGREVDETAARPRASPSRRPAGR